MPNYSRSLAPLILTLSLGSALAYAEAGPHDLDFYVGTWTCEATVYANGAASQHMRATAEMKRVLDGHWISVHMDFMPSGGGDKGSESLEMRGFDPDLKRWVHVAFVNQPGGFSLEASPGFVGDAMTWMPVALPGDAAAPIERSVLVKLSNNRYRFYAEQSVGKGWQRTFEKTCTRTLQTPR